ncbi:MAG: hypothetical protein Q8O24_05355 [Gallionellaceae bacterium]|nr:hypothetical protein [Gallionellaceae bacterium]
MNIQAMNDRQYGLLFGVCRSIRYHDRRRAFFERLHQITSGLTVLLAGSVLFELAVIAALLSAWDIVVGYSVKASLHRDLKQRFGALEIAILLGLDDDSTWQHHEAERLRIEQDEPPIFRALDMLCHNELLTADGLKRGNGANFATLNAWQRTTRHFFHWADSNPV